MSFRYSIALRKDNTLRIVTTAGMDETYPRTAGNIERLEQYLQTLPDYERRSSDNPEVDEVINFEGYFHIGEYHVDDYLHFTHQPDRHARFHGRIVLIVPADSVMAWAKRCDAYLSKIMILSHEVLG